MDRFTAYIGKAEKNGMGCDRIIGQTYTVCDFQGNVICRATKGSTWRVNSWIGTNMSQFYARRGGREYTGRGFGVGMCINFRETAASKKTAR